MRILIVSATDAEVAPLAATPRPGVDILITGVGMVATAARCSRALAETTYDLALNLGLCGSFDRSLSVGTVVHVRADRLAELGAQDGDNFLTIHDLRLLGEDEFPFKAGQLINLNPPESAVLKGLPAVDAITVNTAHGNDRSIESVKQRFKPHIESMEGAAFMYSCLMAGVRFAQVRAVSNVVEKRNRESWKITEAVENLNTTALDLLRTL